MFSYGMARQPGQPVPLTAVPCPGYVVNAPTVKTPTGANGGIAPNGQPCPVGLYFGTASTQNGGGNIWHHYSGIGKLQWNHVIDDHSFYTVRLAENFNQYIFDQPIVDANIPSIENSPDFQVSPTCPALPYTPGTPIMSSKPNGAGSECVQQDNWFSTGYYGDRRSEMYLGSLDYSNDLNANTTIKAGVSEEYDDNLNNSYFSFYFNPDGSWPGINYLSSYPDHIISGYINPSFRARRWLLEPGLLYQRMSYDFPGGPYSVGIWNPTFAATYSMTPNDVIRGSYTDSTSFIGTSYVYRTGSSLYDPGNHVFSAAPTIIHSGDLMWEHQFNSNTSMKVGPYFNIASNTFYLFRPILSIAPSGTVKYGPQQASNGGYRQSVGAELGINHDDRRPIGTSWWLAATYDNFWTNITSSLTGSYNGAGLPSFLGRIRNTGNPLLSVTMTADMHENGLHLIPQVYYQSASPYNVGRCGTTPPYGSCARVNTTVGLAPESWSSGYFWVNASAYKQFGPQKQFKIGVQVTNLLNQLSDTTPCFVGTLGSTPQLGPGCGPFYPVGYQTGVPSSGYAYQNYSQNPRQIQVFFSTKLP
jgi:hypothetical protein